MKWLTKNQMMDTGKSCFIPQEIEVNGEWVVTGRWYGSEPIADILLPPGRCEQLGCPVRPKESPAAYIYKAAEKSAYRYIPLYTRFIEDIDIDKATELEKKVLSYRRGDGVRDMSKAKGR
ncbi:hypothetical protein D3C77_407760 [compost metagenome]